MKIGVIGAGYVGTTTSIVFAKYGYQVTLMDTNLEKIKTLYQSKLPFYEEGLKELLHDYIVEQRLSFTNSMEEIMKECNILFITVGTPSLENGKADLSFVEEVVTQMAKYMDDYKVIVIKSTVPVGTGDKLNDILKNELKIRNKAPTFDLVSNPEFLREGKALFDALYPDRVIVGCESTKAREIMKELYKDVDTSILFTTIKEAEMIKYASNAFLATKISFINELARLCDGKGVNINQVALGMGMDKRIGPDFLQAGIGYGGSCFPKDIKALLALAFDMDTPMPILQAVKDINETQSQWFMKKVKQELGNLEEKRIAILGLTFKPKTDDIREAPALKVIDYLLKNKASVTAYDPQGSEHVKKIYPTVTYTPTPLQALEDADAVLLLTEWQEILDIDWECAKSIISNPLLFDGRNALSPSNMMKLGYRYFGVGNTNF
ncbi:UDP-glucose dehydrogenase family protein [Heyndrickxia camelliae]|uniref:UDP-glucose 6-dehydrogenase n=1 Tax=Heyndrickxia camelliae TaxID=1707093 RepID=A0A2N3LK78_9BACI|nr:UDP-glucose/GDP-mannose dehydrogenase family protein [Heyndrickxia camelliae]PKR84964.1 nucleotide sugar dehydrogenase [Heyndrickxia camelliae]